VMNLKKKMFRKKLIQVNMSNSKNLQPDENNFIKNKLK
jgi:hypothetical protein